MKNICFNFLKRLLQFQKKIKELFFAFIKGAKKDFSFHNSYTELLAIWTILFMSVTGLFVLAIKNNILVILFLFALSVAIMLAGTLFTIYYLHSLRYHKQNQFLPKAHNFLNKSFQLRTLLRLIKIPHASILNNLAKNFKLAS